MSETIRHINVNDRHQAKRGRMGWRFQVVQELINPEKIEFSFDRFIAVVQFDRDKPNALPLIYATAFAKYPGTYLEINIRQMNVVCGANIVGA